MLRQSLPFWFTRMFDIIFTNIDKVMLAWMASYQITGIYGAASTMVNALIIIPVVFMYATFPAMSFFHIQKSGQSLALIFRKTCYYLLTISIPLTVGCVLLADRLILFAYHNTFVASGAILKILSLSFPFIFIGYVTGFLLNAINRAYLFSIAAGIGAALNIVLNMLLIPRFGAPGAAYGTVLSQMVTFLLLQYFASISTYAIKLFTLAYRPGIALLS